MDAGVDSLKIEGRNRPPDYVHTVIAAYRQAIDAWAVHQLTDDLKKELVTKCRSVFNRDFSDGFFLGRPITDFTENENNAATRKRTLVGKIINYYQRSGIARLWLQNGTISDTEDLVIMGPTTGVVECHVDAFRREDDPTLTPHATATFPCPVKLRANDIVYKVFKP